MLMLQLELDRKAKEYIVKKGGVVTVGCVVIGGGWCGKYVMPTVTVGEPDQAKEYYRVLDVEGIKVYLSPSLQPTQQIPRIVLHSFLFLRRFVVHGFRCA